MFDLKVINSVLTQLEDERGIPREKIIDAIETALATAYKKEYGKRGQIIRSKFNIDTGEAEFFQVKIVVDETQVRIREEHEEEDGGGEHNEREQEEKEEKAGGEEKDDRPYFNAEHHIFVEDAQRIKRGTVVGDEMVFPLEPHENYGRIAAQTAKQVIIQKIREAEKVSVFDEFSKREHEILSGTVQRLERGNIFVDLGRITGILPFDEQIPGERYRNGERIRAYLYSVEETPRGVFLRLSRSHPQFLQKLFELEAPEIAAGTVEVKSIAREAGSRSKIAVISHDDHIDPVGSLVGQRGVRVSTVMSELGGEKIDIIEWSLDPAQFIEDALSPAKVVRVEVHSSDKHAIVEVSDDQQSLAIGKGGQNVRLAAKLTGWKIDIRSIHGGDTRKKSAGDKTDTKEEGVAAEKTETVSEVVEEALEIVENPEAALAETGKKEETPKKEA